MTLFLMGRGEERSNIALNAIFAGRIPRPFSVDYYDHLLRSTYVQWVKSQFSDPTGRVFIYIFIYIITECVYNIMYRSI